MSDPYVLKDDDKLTATFRHHKVINHGKSEAAKERVYDDMEICEIRMPANRNSIPCFPAHFVSHWLENPETGEKEPVTYAMRFAKQYDRFLKNQNQVQEGTPLSRVEGITDAQVLRLKAHGILTAEQMAFLDGPPLKNLGMEGRPLKNLCQAHLDKAKNTQDELRAEIAELRAKLNAKDGVGEPQEENTDGPSIADLKAKIKELSGSAPRGNPSRETLERMVSELEGNKAA